MEGLTLTEKRQVKERERYTLEGKIYAIELTAQKKAWKKTAMPGYVYYPMLTEINQILGRAKIVDQDGNSTVVALSSSDFYPGYVDDGPKDERYTGPFRLEEILPEEEHRDEGFVDAFAEFLIQEAKNTEYNRVRRAPVLDLTHVKEALPAYLNRKAESTNF